VRTFVVFILVFVGFLYQHAVANLGFHPEMIHHGASVFVLLGTFEGLPMADIEASSKAVLCDMQAPVVLELAVTRLIFIEGNIDAYF